TRSKRDWSSDVCSSDLRHDGRTWLQVRQVNLSETGQWAGAHEADVVSHLVQGDSNNTHCAGELNESVAVSLCLEVVLCFRQLVDAGELLEFLCHLCTEVSGGVEAGTSSGAADSEFAEARKGCFDALDA